MKKQHDPEAAKLKAEADKREMDAICHDIREMTAKIPKSVISGDYAKAVSYKEIAIKALKVIDGKRPNIKTARELRDQLQRFA